MKPRPAFNRIPDDESDFEGELAGFSRLTAAVIDSCSIIYLDRLMLFAPLQNATRLFIVPGVRQETGFPLSDCREVTGEHACQMSVDQQIVAAARQLNTAVISEDRHILRNAWEHDLPHYNSGMIICYLRWSGVLSGEQACSALQQLDSFARYAEPIHSYCRKLLLYIEKVV